MNGKKDVLKNKSFAFALDCIYLYKLLAEQKKNL